MMHGALLAFIHVWYRRLTACSRRKSVTTATCVLLLTFFTYFVSRHSVNLAVIPDVPIPVTVKLISVRHSMSSGLNLSTVTPTPRVHTAPDPLTSPQNHAMGRSVSQVSARESDTEPSLPSPKLSPSPLDNGSKPDSNSIVAGLSSASKSKDLTGDKYYDIDSIPFDYGTDSEVDFRKSPQQSSTTRYPEQNVTILTDVSSDLKRTSLSPTSVRITDKHQSPTPAPQDEIDYKTESESPWSSGPSPGQRETLTTKEAIVYDPKDVNLLALKPFQLLKDYKNPCWSETVETWYADNTYMDVENVEAVLTRMSAILRLRQERGDNHRIRCLPYFFIIGQPKCGSTDLYEKLTAHPEIIRPPTKEPHWWTRARLGRRRIHGEPAPLDDYLDLFDYAAYNIEQRPTVSPDTGNVFHRRITGEASMSTFWDNDHWWAMVGNENSTEPRVLTQHYIRHLLPGSKFVLILRNPSTRMYSDYLYFRKEVRTPQDFHNDVVNAIGVYENCTQSNSIRHCVYNSTVHAMAKVRLRIGMYSVFLEDWLSVFPQNQFYIVRTEDYAADPRIVLRGLFKFLGLGALSESHEDQILARRKANTRRQEDRVIGDMLPETRKLLDAFYRPTNQRLAALLNDNRYLWGDAILT